MQLFFRKYGSGYPLIILHGLLGMSDNWVTIANKFSDKFTVYLPDLRNHGYSPHSSNFSYELMVSDLLEFFYKEISGSAYLLGHSMGGKVAMKFALENPDFVEKLIIEDISPKEYDKINSEEVKAMLSVDFSFLKKRIDVENYLTEKIKSKKVVQLILKNLYWKDSENLDWKLNIEAIAENIDEVYKWNIFKNAFFYKPVLFIRGSESDYIAEPDKSIIYDYFKNCKIETIENAGHWVHADKPDEFYNKLSEFLLEKQ